MSINGICHDFAFASCYDKSVWDILPGAKPDAQLWPLVQQHMKHISVGEINSLKKGVLTVVNPSKAGGSASYCTHSYYTDGKKLYSSNDPFFDKLPIGKISITSVHSSVEVPSYSIQTFVQALTPSSGESKTAKLSGDSRPFQFYWCSAECARTGWWKAPKPSKKSPGAFKKFLNRFRLSSSS